MKSEINGLNRCREIAKAALFVAGEIGADKSAYVEALNFAHAYDRGCKETIERCAREAERYDEIGAIIAAAIRALKEQP